MKDARILKRQTAGEDRQTKTRTGGEVCEDSITCGSRDRAGKGNSKVEEEAEGDADLINC